MAKKVNDELILFMIKLIDYSPYNSELRERYANGIISTLMGSKYIKGEYNKADELYNYLLNIKGLIPNIRRELKNKLNKGVVGIE